MKKSSMFWGVALGWALSGCYTIETRGSHSGGAGGASSEETTSTEVGATATTSVATSSTATGGPTCVSDNQPTSTASACCSHHADDFGYCCTGTECCAAFNHSYASSANECSCDPGYEWASADVDNFKCSPIPTPQCSPGPANESCNGGYQFCSGEICCADDYPFYCASTNSCYATDADAASQCGGDCVACKSGTVTNPPSNDDCSSDYDCPGDCNGDSVVCCPVCKHSSSGNYCGQVCCDYYGNCF